MTMSELVRVTRPANGTPGSDMLASNRILYCSSALNSKFVSLNNCSCFLNTSANFFLYGTVESLKIRLFLATGLPPIEQQTRETGSGQLATSSQYFTRMREYGYIEKQQK